MLRILFAFVALSFSLLVNAATLVPPSDPNDTMDVELAVGFGYHLCGRHENLPPLETAFLCPGLAPTLQNVKLTLIPQNTAKPQWKLWSGTFKDKLIGFDNVVFENELLIMYAMVDGKNYVFIDGRITDTRSKQPSYFRITSYGGFDQLDSTHNFGRPVEIKAKTGELMDLSAIVTIAKKRESAKPKKP